MVPGWPVPCRIHALLLPRIQHRLFPMQADVSNAIAALENRAPLRSWRWSYAGGSGNGRNPIRWLDLVLKCVDKARLLVLPLRFGFLCAGSPLFIFAPPLGLEGVEVDAVLSTSAFHQIPPGFFLFFVGLPYDRAVLITPEIEAVCGGIAVFVSSQRIQASEVCVHEDLHGIDAGVQCSNMKRIQAVVVRLPLDRTL